MKADLLSALHSRRAILGLLGSAAGAAVLTGLPGPAYAAAMLRYQNLWNSEANTHYAGMQYLYEKFAAMYPDIQIQDIQIPTGELAKKNMADCAAGDCPEIMHDLNRAGDQWGPGYLLDLAPHLDADAAWKSKFFETALQFGSTDGHIWGLPAEITPMPSIWNARLLEKAGLGDVPKTVEEFLTAGDRLKANGVAMVSLARDTPQMLHNLVVSQEGGLEALSNNALDAPQFLKAFEIMKALVDNGLTPANDIELNSSQANAMFVSEQLALMINGMWTIRNDLMSKSATPDLIDVVRFAPFPSAGTVGTVVENKVATLIGLASSLGSQPERLDAALTFLKFWFEPEMAKVWLEKTWSPIGVQIDLVSAGATLEAAPKAFIGSFEQADLVYSLPPTKAMQERQWDDAKSAGQALMTGQNAQGALDTYLTEMGKYI